MTTGTKWLLMGLGLLFIFMTGSFAGLLLIVWVGIALVLLFRQDRTGIARPVSVDDHGSLQDVAAKLQLQIDHEENTDVRQGLVRALEVIDAARGHSTYQPVIPLQPFDTTTAEEWADLQDESSLSRPLDQTAALLYIGALLFVGGMGLFIVYGGMSNLTRLVLIILLAAFLYVVGLMLYRAKESLRPAAVTFLAISLVLVPLSGYAAVYLLGAPSKVTWLVTSVIGLTAYVIALFRTRAEIISYVVYLAWLSLVESAANLFGASVAWFVWTAYGVGVVTQLLVPALTRYDEIIGRPLWWSSMAIAPLGLFVSLLLLGNDGMELWEFGVTLLLASGYYLSCIFGVAYAADKSLDRQGYAILAHIFAVLGLLVLCYEKVELLQFGAILMLGALLHVLAWILSNQRLAAHGRYEKFLYIAGLILSILAWVPATADASWLLTGVGLTVVLGGVLATLKVRQSSLLTMLVASLILPVVATNAAMERLDDLSSTALNALLYVVLFLCYVLARHLMPGRLTVTPVMIAGYVGALAIGWMFALWSGEYSIQLGVSVLVALVAVASSYVEHAPRAIVMCALAGVISWYLFLGHSFGYYIEFGEVLAYTLLLNAVCCYVISLISGTERSRLMVFATLVSGILAWLIMLVLDGPMWLVVGPVWLSAMAGLLVVEKQKLSAGAYFDLMPVGLLVLALTEFMARLETPINWLVYTHLWTGYLVYVIYVMKRNVALQSSIDTVKFLALGLLTIPVILQALAEGEAYNMLLLAEQVAILLVGVLTGRKYLTKWATVTIILVMLYMLRSFGYLQLVLVALSLIGYALYRLGRKP